MRCNLTRIVVLFVLVSLPALLAGATEPAKPSPEAAALQLDPSPLDNWWYFKDYCPVFGGGTPEAEKLVVKDIDSDGRAEIFTGLFASLRCPYLGVTESMAGLGTYTLVGMAPLAVASELNSILVEDINGDDQAEILAGTFNYYPPETLRILDGSDLEALTEIGTATPWPPNHVLRFAYPSPDADYPWIYSGDNAVTEVLSTEDMQVMDRLFYGAEDFEVGDVYDDPHVEIVYGSGEVVYYDGVSVTLLYEYFWDEDTTLNLVNLDDDPQLEIVKGTFSGGPMGAYNYGDPTPFQTWPTITYPIGLYDVLGDESAEIVAKGTDGSINAIDVASRAIVWTYHPPTAIWNAATGDTDGDGQTEMVLTTGSSMSVLDVATQVEEWASESLVKGPFSAVAIDDLGNDGNLELIFATENGVGADDVPGSWVFVVDAATHEELLRTQLPLTGGGRLYDIGDIETGDVDGDGKPEIALLGTAVSSGDGYLIVLDGETFVEDNQFAISTSGGWSSLRIADVDNDTEPEFVAGGPSPTFPIDHTHRIWVLDAATGAVEWESPAYEGAVGMVEVAQADEDARLEIIGVESRSGANDILHIIDCLAYTSQYSNNMALDYTSLSVFDIDQNSSSEEILLGTSNGIIQALGYEITGRGFFERLRFQLHSWGISALKAYTITGGDVRLAILSFDSLFGVHPWTETVQWQSRGLKPGSVTGEKLATSHISTDTGAMIAVGTTGTVHQFGGVVQQGRVAFASPSYSVDEDAGSITVTVQRLGSTAGSVTAQYATADRSATAGSDYASAGSFLTWADGDGNDKSIVIPILDDGTPELAETFVVNMTNVTGGLLDRPSQARVTIIDNDSSVVDFVETTATVGETTGSVILSVARTVDISEAGSVDWATSDGTALAGSDYTAASGTLNWTAGDGAPQPIEIDILDDSIFENDETFTVVLSNPGGNAVVGESGTAVVTITSDDVIELAFTSATYSAGEGDGVATITARRTGASNSVVTVDFASADGTATAGSDYTAVGDTLVWADGDTADKTFEVPLTDDGLVEPVETVALALAEPTGGATIGSQGTAELGIQDNDGTLLQFVSSSHQAMEDDGSIGITLERIGSDTAGAAAVTVTSVNGSATAGLDYQTVSETVTWADGDAANKTVTVTLLDDAFLEGAETFQLELADPTGNAAIGAPAAITVSIEDDDLEESPVNTVTEQQQTQPDVAMSPDGRAVVVWESYLQDGDGWGVFGQRFAANGLPDGAEFQVNATSAGSQRYPAAAMRADGGFTVVWLGADADGDGIVGRRFTADGTPIGSDVIVNPTTAGDQSEPDVAVDGSGAGLVVWQSDGSGNLEIRGRRLDASGSPTGSELGLNSTTAADQQLPAVAGSSTGGFVVAWQSYGQDGPAEGIMVRRFAGNGAPQSSEIIANDFTSGDQLEPAVGATGSGDFVVVWSDPNHRDGSYSSIQARWFDTTATPMGGDIRVNTFTTGDQLAPAVACAGQDDAIIIWQSDGQDGSNWGVYGQPQQTGGDPIGPELRFNTHVTSAQHGPVIARSDAGTFWAVWASAGQDGSGDGVYGLFGEMWVATEIFVDGFESGDTGAWGP